MKQVLHIFRKDSRHFWPEILIYFAILAAFVLIYPSQWQTMDFARRSQLGTICRMILYLVVATWGVVIARLIHSEALVGENQFWLTRPYHRTTLLAAKLLFLAVWLCLPFVVAQSALLAEAGFHPLPILPHLILKLLLLNCYVFLPLFTLAAVTANFGRMALSLLGIVLTYAGISFLSASSAGYNASPPYPHHLIYPLIFLLGSGVVIAIQYAARRVWLSRGIMVATGVLLVAASVALSKAAETMVTRAYPPPAPSAASPIQLAFAEDKHYRVGVEPSERMGQMYIDVPVRFSGVAPGYAVQPDNVKFTITAPDGFTWTAPWWTTYPRQYLPGSQVTSVQIMISRDLYDRYKYVPLTLQITLAVTQLQPGQPTQTTISDQDFAAPGFGVCSIHGYRYGPGISCRAAVDAPPLTSIQTTLSISPCSGPQPSVASAPYESADAWAGEVYSDSVTPDIIPMQFVSTNLSIRRRDGLPVDMPDIVTYGIGPTLCPGTPITFTPYHIIGRTQVGLSIPNFKLSDRYAR